FTLDGGWLGETMVTSTPVNPEQLSAVAFDGTRYLLVWQDASLDGGIRGARVASDGGVLDAAPLRLSPEGGAATSPALASGASSFLVAWQLGTSIFATRLGSDGGVAQAPFLVSTPATAPGPLGPHVAFDGQHFLVAWQNNVGGSQLETVTVHE